MTCRNQLSVLTFFNELKPQWHGDQGKCIEGAICSTSWSEYVGRGVEFDEVSAIVECHFARPGQYLCHFNTSVIRFLQMYLQRMSYRNLKLFFGFGPLLWCLVHPLPGENALLIEFSSFMLIHKDSTLVFGLLLTWLRVRAHH